MRCLPGVGNSLFRRSWLVAVVGATAFTLAALFPAVSFADNANCLACHQNSQTNTRTGVVTPAQVFDVAAVDYSTACPKCHLDFAGSHPYHNADSNCGAVCHRFWGAALTANVPLYTAALGGGFKGGFAAADSTATSPAVLHIIHSKSRWMGDKTKPGSACSSCHAVAACDACHEGVISAAHAGHAAKTLKPTVTSNVSRGVIAGNQADGSGFSPAEVSSCGGTVCHNSAGVVAGTPGLKDDKVHVASPANDYLANPTIIKSGTWLVVKASAYTMGQSTISNAAGSTFSVPFNGTQLTLVADKDPFRGVAEILIDNVSKGTVDLYQSNTVNQVEVWRSAILASGDHTITVRATGTKRSSARAAYVSVDQFKIYTTTPGKLAPRCSTCHGDAVTLHGLVHDGDPTFSAYVRGEVSYNAPADGQRHTSGRILTCITCHKSSNLVTVHLGENSCLLCHGTGGPRSSFTTWDKTCMQGGCHTPTQYANGIPMIQHNDDRAYAIHNVVAVAPVRDPLLPRGGCVTDCHNGGCLSTCHTVKDGTTDRTAPLTRASMVSTDPVTWKLYPVDSQSGVVQTFYSYDGAPFLTYGAAEAAAGLRGPLDALRVGAHSLRYYSVDASGNVEATKTSNYVTTGIDATPPVTTTTGIRNGSSVVATSFAISVLDPTNPAPASGAASLHVEYKTYYKQWEYYAVPTPWWEPVNYTMSTSSWDTTQTFTRLEDQAWTGFGGGSVSNKGGWMFVVRYYATDYAGNSSALTEDTVSIDTAAPSTTIATVTAGEYRWKLNPYDFPAGIDSTYYSFDNAPFVKYSVADTANGIVNTQPGGAGLGAHTLRYYSTDTLGHAEPTKTHAYSIIETTPPMASLSATMTSSSVTISAWDPVGPLQRSGVKSIVGTVSNGVVTKSITTTFPAGDPAAVRSVEVTVPSDGSWSLVYYVYDWDGNATWCNQGFKRDTSPPTSSLGGTWNPDSWQLSSSDGFGIGLFATYYRFDNDPYQVAVYAGWAAYPPTPAAVRSTYGTHTISYYGVDLYGFTEVPKSTSFLVPDTAKPTLTLTKSSAAASYKTAYLTAQDSPTVPSGIKQIWYRIDGGAWVTVPFNTSANPAASVQTEILGMANGTRTVESYTVDVAGNASAARIDYLNIDSNAPS